MKTIASLLSLSSVAYSQSAPIVPAIPAVPTSTGNPQPPGLNLAPPGQAFGAFGQLCDIPAAYTACQMITDLMTPQNPGFTKCEKDFDCCMCGGVQCGDVANPCEAFSAGNYGVYGVKNILISGRAAGAHIKCLGVEACAESEMATTFVSYIQGAGVMALKNAVITITNPVAFFSMECIDEFACEGLQVTIDIEAPPSGMQCNPLYSDTLWFEQISCVNENSCRNMQININNHGCQPIRIRKLQCVQTNSCDGAAFNFVGDVEFLNCDLRGSAGTLATGIDTCFDNLQKLSCPDATSCREVSQTLRNPLQNFLLLCGQSGSCQDATFYIEMDTQASALVTVFEGFKFASQYAASGITVVMSNKQGSVVNIERIECVSIGACKDATFIIGHDVSVGEILCTTGACQNCQIKITELSPGIPCDPNDVGLILPPGYQTSTIAPMIPIV